MKASELRIGNLVNYGGVTSEVSRVDKLFFYVEASETPTFSKDKGRGAKPIQLTEEWLLKLGFSAKNWYSNFEHWSDTWFQLSSSVIKANKERSCFYLDNEMINIEIKYVHQLQNLYFAFTGEELTLEP